MRLFPNHEWVLLLVLVLEVIVFSLSGTNFLSSANAFEVTRLSVELVAMRPFYVIGEVGRVGQFPYVNCLRVIQAVAIAGGFTRRAGRTRLTIKRFYATSAEEEYVTEDTLAEPGDVIRVPERWF